MYLDVFDRPETTQQALVRVVEAIDFCKSLPGHRRTVVLSVSPSVKIDKRVLKAQMFVSGHGACAVQYLRSCDVFVPPTGTLLSQLMANGIVRLSSLLRVRHQRAQSGAQLLSDIEASASAEDVFIALQLCERIE